jgi:hypothetical protein
LTPGTYFVTVAFAEGQETNLLGQFDRAVEFTIASSTFAIAGAELDASFRIED